MSLLQHIAIGDVTQLAAQSIGNKRKQTGRLHTEERTTGSICSRDFLKPSRKSRRQHIAIGDVT
jgi:hypothetical protein